MHVTGGCGCSFNMHHGACASAASIGSNTYDDDTSIAAAQAVPQLQPQTFETRRVLALVWGGVMMMAATMVVGVEVVVVMMLVIATTDAAAIQICPPSASRFACARLTRRPCPQEGIDLIHKNNAGLWRRMNGYGFITRRKVMDS